VTPLRVAEVAVLQRFPVKSMGGERLESVDVLHSGLVGDREWAVYGADGKLASGKHSARFRRMDPVFELVARRDGGHTVVVLPDGAEHVAGEPGTDDALSQHFGEQVWLRRETDVMHQDQATFSLVGTATLVELGHHEGDGAPVDPRHVRANLVVQTDQAYAEESWIGREVTMGTVRVRVTEAIQRCRMVGVAQVGLPERPGMLRAISEHHDLLAGVYATVLRRGRVAVGDGVRPA
jgi:uncharacterized protein YcbX